MATINYFLVRASSPNPIGEAELGSHILITVNADEHYRFENSTISVTNGDSEDDVQVSYSVDRKNAIIDIHSVNGNVSIVGVATDAIISRQVVNCTPESITASVEYNVAYSESYRANAGYKLVDGCVTATMGDSPLPSRYVTYDGVRAYINIPYNGTSELGVTGNIHFRVVGIKTPTITRHLTNCYTSKPTVTEVVMGESYSETLYANSGGVFLNNSDVSATMDGEPLNSACYIFNINRSICQIKIDASTGYSDGVTGNIVITASATVKYLLTYNSNGGSSIPSIYTSLVGTLPTPVWYGHNFLGWYYDNTTFTRPVIPTDMLTANTTIYAKWSELTIPLLTYNSNGGSLIPSERTLVIPSPLPIPVKVGYDFAGWYYDNTTFEEPVSEGDEIESNTTIYAKWVTTTQLSINLYRNTAEKNRVDKSDYLTSAGTLYGTFRSSVDIVNPSIQVECEKVNFNYVYIQILGRYYYVVGVTSDYKDLWTVHLKCDVLMTYKDSILNLTAYIERCESSTYINSKIRDDMLPVSDEITTYTYSVDSDHINLFSNDNVGINQKRFILSDVISNAYNQGEKVSYGVDASTRLWVLSANELSSIISDMFSVDFTHIFSDSNAAYVGLMYFPFDISHIETNVAQFKVGNSSRLTPLTTYGFLKGSDGVKTINFGTIDVGNTSVPTDFLDYQPYCSVDLYLPYYGFVSVDPRIVMRKSIGIKYKVDMATGRALIEVSEVRDEASDILLYQYEAIVAKSIPLSQTNSDAIARQLATGIVSTAATILAIAMV